MGQCPPRRPWRPASSRVGDDVAPLAGTSSAKRAEGVLDIRQVLEKVQMVRLHVQDDGHRGEEVQEGVAVLAGLQDDGVSRGPPGSPQCSRGRVPPIMTVGSSRGRHEDVGAHGGGGGLAVGAGDAQGVLIVLHDGAPGLGPLIDGDAPGDGPGDLGVARRGRRRCGSPGRSPSGSPREWPMATWMPRDRRWRTVSLSRHVGALHHAGPCPAAPPPAGHMDTPPMPARWTRTPGLRNVLISTVGCIILGPSRIWKIRILYYTIPRRSVQLTYPHKK